MRVVTQGTQFSLFDPRSGARIRGIKNLQKLANALADNAVDCVLARTSVRAGFPPSGTRGLFGEVADVLCVAVPTTDRTVPASVLHTQIQTQTQIFG